MAARHNEAGVVGTASAGGIPSTLAIRGHPVHPMLVSYPIAFLSATLLTDIISYARDSFFWASCSYWLLIGGTTMGLLAAAAGITDFFGDRRISRLPIAKAHFIGNAIVLCLALVNLAIRMNGSASAGVPLGWLGLSALVVLLIAGTGWLGGEMVYRHRIAVTPARNT
jgi:uncharacterized membrane protein